MQNKLAMQPNNKPALPVFKQSIQSCERNGLIRVRIPVPRRPSCSTRRLMLAALRAAELSEWQATGGDFLNSMHQQVSAR